MTANS